jgi:hypothetical protein
MKSISAEFDQFLSDRTILEVIKADFRSNTAQTVNRSGEGIIRQLIKEAREKKTQLQM